MEKRKGEADGPPDRGPKKTGTSPAVAAATKGRARSPVVPLDIRGGSSSKAK